MTEWITHMTPAEMIERTRKDREAFAALWDGLNDEQMTHRPGPQSDWSVKDLIAHIAFWERHMTHNVEHLLKREATHVVNDLDIMNAHVFAENKDRTLSDVLAEFAAQLPMLETMLSGLSEDDINNPQRFPSRKGTSLLNTLIGDTFGHYGVHRDDLERYVNSLKG